MACLQDGIKKGYALELYDKLFLQKSNTLVNIVY